MTRHEHRQQNRQNKNQNRMQIKKYHDEGTDQKEDKLVAFKFIHRFWFFHCVFHFIIFFFSFRFRFSFSFARSAVVNIFFFYETLRVLPALAPQPSSTQLGCFSFRRVLPQNTHFLQEGFFRGQELSLFFNETGGCCFCRGESTKRKTFSLSAK